MYRRISLSLHNIMFYILGNLVQYIRTAHQTQEILDGTGIVEAVADAFIQHELHVDILSLHHAAVLLYLNGSSLHAESAEAGKIAEVIQVMVDGRNPQRGHGGNVERAMKRRQSG